MYTVPTLPLERDFDSNDLNKQLIATHRALGELKGITEIIPNQGILISTLALQEAKESSEIENIITTHDELYQSDFLTKHFTSKSAKEVYNYAAAALHGFEKVQQHGLLTNTCILEVQSILEENTAGFRALPGTTLKNDATKEVVYTPPQSAPEIKELMHNLESYINDEAGCSLDPLIKMAIIHHQFESIHPFYDGNGRTGRIINVLYLVKEGLLDTPVLYLSRYINPKKTHYYELLQAVRKDPSNWEDWVMFLLEGVQQTSKKTTFLIQSIRDLMLEYKHHFRERLPKIYSQELLNNLFRHPYTKVEFVTRELGVHRNTARRYLEELTKINLLTKTKLGKETFYINPPLFTLLSEVGKP